MEFVSERAKEVCGGEVFHLVQWYDEENDRWFDFLTNDLTLEAEEVAELYRSRWEIELFFNLNFLAAATLKSSGGTFLN